MNVCCRLKIAYVMICLLFLLWCRSTYGAVETVWTYQSPSGGIDNSPAIVDVDGDGRSEVIVACKGGYIIAVDSLGHELWLRDDVGSFSAPPTVANVQGDLTPEVLAVNRNGKIVCLNAKTGQSVWDWDASAEWDETVITAADINADSLVEIISVDREGGIVCLSGDGDILWTHTVNHGASKFLCPAIGDLDGDGMLEILLSGTQVPLICLNHDGSQRWSLSQEGCGSSPVLCDLQGDGRPEIVMGIHEEIAVLDCQGTILWKYKMDSRVEHAISVVDVDGDGRMEIFAGDQSGKFVGITNDGTGLWSTSVGYRLRRSPSIADVDGDGEVEILIAGVNSNLQIYNTKGELKERVSLNGRGADSTPTVADLEGDGRLCVVVPIMEGGLKAFRWPEGKPHAKVLWPEFRFNAARTASTSQTNKRPAVQIARIDYGGNYVGKNRFAVEISNPEQRELTIQLEIRKSQAAPVRRKFLTADKIFKAQLPYYVTGREVVDLSFDCLVLEKGQPIFDRSHTEHIVPFANEIADIEADLAELDRLISQLPDTSGIFERSRYFQQRLSSSRSITAQGQIISGPERTKFRSELRQLLHDSLELKRTVASAVAACQSGEGSLVISAANPWAPFGGMDEAAEHRIRPAELVVEAFAGEVESAALNLLNFSSQPVTLRIMPSSLKTEMPDVQQAVPARQVITLHEVTDVGTENKDLSADALPLLNQAQTILVPAWGARQLWLNVNTDGLAPGRWRGQIDIRSLGIEPLQVSASLDLTVWQAHLPEKQPLSLCHWGYVHSSVLKDQPAAALEDQVAHYTDVFVGQSFPRAKFDENGDLVGPIDFQAHDQYVRRHAPHGIILFCGYQGALRGPSDHDSPAYKRAHVKWLRAWVKHLAELGVGYEGYALYPVDEPGLRPGLVEIYLKYAKLAREADPKILMYTDPVNTDPHRKITMEELHRMAPYVDIWCPNRGGFLMEHRSDQLHIEGARMLDFLKSTGSTVWTYECEGNVKKRSPLAYYRGQAWLAWQHELTGIGFWSYCTSQDDPWFVPKSRDYLLIYQGNGVVPSKRWEAIRDGVEDYSMLALLKDKVDQVQAQGVAGEFIRAARKILQADTAEIARFCSRDQDSTEPAVQEGFPAARIIADERWQVIQDTRRRMAALLTEQ